MNRRETLGMLSGLLAGSAIVRPGTAGAVRSPPAPRRATTTSRDGLPLAYTRYGDSGAALVICYGAFTIADDWERVAVELSRTHRVFLYDRRGHGRSPDAGKPYTLDSEPDDLAAMVRVAGADATILGHSFGGGCAIAYALRDRFEGRLVLYEPVHSIVHPIGGEDLSRLRELVAAGDLEAATAFAMTRIVKAPPAAVDAFRQFPSWPEMRAQVRPFPNEVALLDSLRWTSAQLAPLASRVTLLLGSESVKANGAAVDSGVESTVAQLVDRIPATTLLPVPGYGHTAYMENPPLLASVIRRAMAA